MHAVLSSVISRDVYSVDMWCSTFAMQHMRITKFHFEEVSGDNTHTHLSTGNLLHGISDVFLVYLHA